MSWTASANAIVASMSKPDYRRIAALEVETWGQVFTAEAKEFQPVPQRRGPYLWQSDESKQATLAYNEAMLADLGME